MLERMLGAEQKNPRNTEALRGKGQSVTTDRDVLAQIALGSALSSMANSRPLMSTRSEVSDVAAIKP